MSWISLSSQEELEQLVHLSKTSPQVIFKHSTRCSISSVAKSRLEKNVLPGDIQFHYLDLLSHRSLSNHIADRFDVAHQSPQVLIIKDGTCVYDESHLAIDAFDIVEKAQ